MEMPNSAMDLAYSLYTWTTAGRDLVFGNGKKLGILNEKSAPSEPTEMYLKLHNTVWCSYNRFLPSKNVYSSASKSISIKCLTCPQVSIGPIRLQNPGLYLHWQLRYPWLGRSLLLQDAGNQSRCCSHKFCRICGVCSIRKLVHKLSNMWKGKQRLKGEALETICVGSWNSSVLAKIRASEYKYYLGATLVRA